jgi:hypothetical protein
MTKKRKANGKQATGVVPASTDDAGLDQFFDAVPVELDDDVRRISRLRLRQVFIDVERAKADSALNRTSKQLQADLKKLRLHLTAISALLSVNDGLVAQLVFEGDRSSLDPAAPTFDVQLSRELRLSVRGRQLVQASLMSILPLTEVVAAAQTRLAQAEPLFPVPTNAGDSHINFFAFALIQVFEFAYGPPSESNQRDGLWGKSFDEARNKGSALVEFIRVGLRQLELPSDGTTAKYRVQQGLLIRSAFQAEADGLRNARDKSAKS